jgi:DNA-binding transcriptional MerR regulator
MSKAAEAFRTISEVAGELGVPKHVLRFWEAKFPQIRPMKRGGGRRYYRPGDMELLKGIRHLLHADGYTIKGVQKILREQGIDLVKTFARGPAVAVPALEARSGRGRPPGKAATRPAPAMLPGSHEPRPSSTVSPAAGEGARVGPARSEVLARVIAELESCRRLLVDEAGRAETQRRPRRTAGGRS